jgi:hypothetical protein
MQKKHAVDDDEPIRRQPPVKLQEPGQNGEKDDFQRVGHEHDDDHYDQMEHTVSDTQEMKEGESLSTITA